MSFLRLQSQEPVVSSRCSQHCRLLALCFPPVLVIQMPTWVPPTLLLTSLPAASRHWEGDRVRLPSGPQCLAWPVSHSIYLS